LFDKYRTASTSGFSASLGFAPAFLARQMNAAATARLARANPSAVARDHGRFGDDGFLFLAVAVRQELFRLGQLAADLVCQTADRTLRNLVTQHVLRRRFRPLKRTDFRG
jgi:hypothetical protein